MNPVGNDPKERGPGTRDGRKMRTESSRSKHVREERDQTMHKTCQSGTKSGEKLKDVCEGERNVKVGSPETALKAQELSMA